MSPPHRPKTFQPARAVLAVLALTVSALVVATGGPSAATRPAVAPVSHPNDVLSSPSATMRGSGAGLEAPHAVRARLATLKQSLFPDDVRSRPRVRFNLFEGASYTGVINRTETGLGTRSWIGSLTHHQGYFYAARSGDAMVLHVATFRHGIYEVSLVRGSTYRVVRLAADAPEDARQVLPTPARIATRARALAPDSRARIDVMVVWSNQALAEEGSTSAMKARIALAVTETNAGYASSGITTRIRLVHVMPAGYDESLHFATDLRRITRTSDGFMDNVHTERDVYGADMVALIVHNVEFCGLPGAIMSIPSTAFTTVSDSCMTGYYAFGHEFGHLQGARHDAYTDPTSTPFTFGHGYVNVAQRWRTVMAYNNKCADRGVDCTRLNRWSNPNQQYGGHPLGTRRTQNWKVLNKTAAVVANFRHATIASDFSSSMDRAAGARHWYPVVGTWTKASTSYFSTGVAGTRSSARHSGSFGDVTVAARVRRTVDLTDANALVIGTHGTRTGPNQWSPSYLFQYTNGRMFSVYKVAGDGTTVALAPWTASSAIAAKDWNRLKFSKVGGSLRFWINDTLVWSGVDQTLERGQVGVSFVQPATRSGRLYVDWFRARNNPTAADVVP